VEAPGPSQGRPNIHGICELLRTVHQNLLGFLYSDNGPNERSPKEEVYLRKKTPRILQKVKRILHLTQSYVIAIQSPNELWKVMQVTMHWVVYCHSFKKSA